MKNFNGAESRFSSWSYAEKGFEDILSELRSGTPAMSKSAGLINESSGKMVWRLARSANGREYDFAYKINPRKTPWRYIFSPSLAVREAENYCMFEAMGLPVAHVLAVGDVRKFFILKENFIATTYIPGTRDGREFMPGGAFRENDDLLREYTRQNFLLLARIHDNNVFHKAFHPRNLLWRENDGKLEVFWIDVARCRKVGKRRMDRAVLVDLHTYFRDMKLTYEELEEYVGYYLANRCNGTYTGGKTALINALFKFRRRMFSRKRYTITG